MTRRRPLVRRRELTGLLAASGSALLLAGCGRPRPVPTSDDVPLDPLARLDGARWDGRSAAEVLSLPITGAADELEAWADLGTDDAAADPARQQLIGFLEAAYLSPDALRGLDDTAAREHVNAAAPEYWLDDLQSAWDGGERHAYAFALAEGYRTVGRPALAMDWFRAERDGTPLLLLGGTVAWSVLETTTHAVGVVAYRLGIGADLEADGTIASASLRVAVHGLDSCAVQDQDGLIVPALADAEEHRAAQQATTDTVLASPRVEQEDLLDPDSALFEGDATTNVACS